jgi:hypothetical protein
MFAQTARHTPHVRVTGYSPDSGNTWRVIQVPRRSVCHIQPIAFGANETPSHDGLSGTTSRRGNYELRSVTSIDQDGDAAEAHLLVDCVRLTNNLGAEKARLASFSCVGRAGQ